MSKMLTHKQPLAVLLGLISAGMFAAIPGFAQAGLAQSSEAPAVESEADGLVEPAEAPIEEPMAPAEPALDEPEAEADPLGAPAPSDAPEAPAEEPMMPTAEPALEGEPEMEEAAEPSLESPAEEIMPNEEAIEELPADGAVTPEELEQFVAIVPQMQTIQQSARQAAIATISASGLTPERFSEISQAEASPEQAVDLSAEEQETYAAVSSELEQIKQNALAEQEQVLQTEGLSPERFDAILTAIQTDPALEQQVQEMLVN